VSKIALLQKIADDLAEQAATAGDASYPGIALLLYEASDLLGDIASAGVDPEDTEVDKNERLREIFNVIYAEAGTVGFAIAATSLVASVAEDHRR